ncbi:hypothetical protein EW145_g909 [Phellinidium pouzarii]|uniref:RING-type domain-containing protein n=1 Tax=Phellinidium pouzarii TaxID=167371 RepID=A0A4S4LIB8_9AGAM|nr:hypothetical protein EW145_g909 [Phellinidium pouzarii]
MTSNISSADVGNDDGNKALGAASNPGSKRSNKMTSGQSLNHLLNFTLPPRQMQASQNIPRRSRKTSSGYGVWNKEKFVNAQYRFVVKPAGDYTVHFADPDIFFQWQDILQVIIPRTSAREAAAGRQDEHEGHTTCPICLSPPSAPRMTKCGHVFCYPCVLHYLNTSDHAKWNRCPICFDSINEKQLKSVKWHDEPTIQDDMLDTSPEASSSSSQIDVTIGDSPQPGSTLHMRLMERPQITTLALPRSLTWPSDLISPHQAPFHFLPDVFRFSRFMLATPAYLLENLSRDLDELASERRILVGMNDELSVSFVDVAGTKVHQQMEKAAALETPELKELIARAEQGVRDLEHAGERGRRSSERERNVKTQHLGMVPEAFLATQGNVPKSTSTSRNQRPRRNINPPPPSSSTYLFYQAASGALIFLHPLDIRILLSHFHSYARFPDNITVRVDASSEGSIDGELRRRCKYLAHIPESADVVFVEADLSLVVSEETLRTFEAPLRARRTKRRERGKKDERARVRAEEREREKLRLPAVPPSASAGYDFVVPPVIERPPSPEEIVFDSPAAPSVSSPAQSGAWGQRSFASAALGGRSLSARQGRPRQELADEDEWDVDVAWHELETQRSGGGRRKRANKLAVLGGAGGRRR